MSIYKGSTKIGTIYHGGTKIEKVYSGSSLVYSGQMSVYNIYSTNQVQNAGTGFFLGEPGANKIVVGGISDYNQQDLLTDVLGTINSISGTPGTAGSSLIARLDGTNYGPFSYLDNFVDSYGSVWYRYTNDPTGSVLAGYVLLSPFHITVGSQLINTLYYKKAVFSPDASTITFYSASAQIVYNAASTLRGTFQYK